jgi:DNA-directed RNA polymerase sigma subunit (sigma70/sigma32)
MSSRPVYTAECQRSHGWWAIRVPEVRGAFSQARRLGQVERMVRDVVALALEVEPDSFDVRLEVTLPEPSRRALEQARELRHEAQLAAASATRATVEAARSMIDSDGLTIREVGQLLGLSHQRIAQLMRQAVPATAAS